MVIAKDALRKETYQKAGMALHLVTGYKILPHIFPVDSIG